MAILKIEGTALITIETDQGPAQYTIPFKSGSTFVWSNPEGLKVTRVTILGGHTVEPMSPEEEERCEHDYDD